MVTLGELLNEPVEERVDRLEDKWWQYDVDNWAGVVYDGEGNIVSVRDEFGNWLPFQNQEVAADDDQELKHVHDQEGENVKDLVIKNVEDQQISEADDDTKTKASIKTKRVMGTNDDSGENENVKDQEIKNVEDQQVSEADDHTKTEASIKTKRVMGTNDDSGENESQKVLVGNMGEGLGLKRRMTKDEDEHQDGLKHVKIESATGTIAAATSHGGYAKD